MLKRLLPFAPIILLFACFPPTAGVDSAASTAVIQTITATMWTSTPATPSATPEPNLGKVVELLNNALLGSDPLAETIEAKYTVLDARIIPDGPANVAGILSIHVDCEWVYSDGCTPEKSFVILMHALTRNEKILWKIYDQIPATVHTLQMVSFDRMAQSGMVVTNWRDVMDYATGKINGNQLGSRITRFTSTP